MMPIPRVLVAGLLIVLLPALAAAQGGRGCSSLSSLQLPGATIAEAASYAPRQFTRRGAVPTQVLSNPVAICRVAATLRPTADSEIGIEVWLPETGWNGRFQGVGNGGWNGSISYVSLVDAVAKGYATASTDTGHVGNSPAFALGHPEKLTDYAYRAHHEMAVAAKRIINAFYGAAPRFSLYNGCSAGGRQGVVEAARFPADYDAVIAGAPAVYSMELHAARVALNVFANRSPDSGIPRAKYAAIHQAVVNACDALDGTKDGLISNPPACHFDAKVLACKGADAATCLTDAQVRTVNALYAPIVNPKSGAPYAPPLLQPGSELGFATLAGPRPLSLAEDAMRFVVFGDASWQLASFNPATDLERTAKTRTDLFATDVNLTPFFARGGKLLMYHGWADPQVTPLNTIRFYDDVAQHSGTGAASMQLFMVPGMNHCRGGEGTDTFDLVAAMEQWVATGAAPAQIPASHRSNGIVDRTRPLCPYPRVAVYTGAGSIDDAANFTCTLR